MKGRPILDMQPGGRSDKAHLGSWTHALDTIPVSMVLRMRINFSALRAENCLLRRFSRQPPYFCSAASEALPLKWTNSQCCRAVASYLKVVWATSPILCAYASRWVWWHPPQQILFLNRRSEIDSEATIGQKRPRKQEFDSCYTYHCVVIADCA